MTSSFIFYHVSSRSRVFEAMFTHKNTTESQTGRVEINDVGGETIEKMLRFIYSDKVEKEEDLDGDLKAIPFPGALLKTREDITRLGELAD